MNVDDFCDYMLFFLFLCYLFDNYEFVVKKEFGLDYFIFEEDDKCVLLSVWYE